MRSWESVAVPSLAEAGFGHGPSVRVHDTSSGALELVGPPDGTARLYVCGITPYDATHLGHANTYLAYDLLQRAWRDSGLDVLYVQNVTDVDDPLLERAEALGQDWVALAEKETELFRTDMSELRMCAPQHYIGAVEAIGLVVEAVDRLEAAGVVYRLDDDIYFDVTRDEGMGRVGHLDMDTMIRLCAQRGGDPDRPGKLHQLDCLLWQGQRPGEPAWDTHFGKGRPGWHIECSAIAHHYLGSNFDVQGGGSDLIFPHHELSASEAQMATGAPLAQHFVHAGMVGLDGEKMSKSKGNLVLVSALRDEGHDPMAVRLALLAHHYRENWFWERSELTMAEGRLESWRDALARVSAAPAGPVVAAMRESLANDLDAPAAARAVDAWTMLEGNDDQAPAAMARAVDALLGIV